MDVLPLVAVHEEAVEHVAEVDEALRAPHALEEVVRALHLRHELREQHGAAVGVHGLHQAVDGGAEVGLVREPGGMRHGRVDAGCVGGHEGGVHAVAGGGAGGRVQRRRVRGDAHGDEHDEEVDPDGQVGQRAEFLQRADLAEEEAGQGPHETADGVAELESGGFRERFAVGDDDGADVADELDRLEYVHQIARPLAVEAEREVAVGFDGVLVGIET